MVKECSQKVQYSQHGELINHGAHLRDAALVYVEICIWTSGLAGFQECGSVIHCQYIGYSFV